LHNGLKFYPPGSNGFIDVRDAVEAMTRLMEGDYNGERFILTAANLSLKDFLFFAADALKVARPKYEVGAFTAGLAWRYEALRAIVSGGKPGFTRDDMDIARVSFNYNSAKVKLATGLAFRSVQQMINDTATCFLESKKGGLDYGVLE